VRVSPRWPWSRASSSKSAAPQLRLDAHRHLVLRDGERIALTAREFSILEYVKLHEEEVCTREQLLEFAWGTAEATDLEIVDRYVGRIRAKLGEGIIETVPGGGYRYRPQ